MKAKPIKQKWVWMRMPEKRYFGRVSIYAGRAGKDWVSIEMVDPIPFRYEDEAYGFSAPILSGSSVADAVRLFLADIRRDRGRYEGRGWRPCANKLSALWRRRGENRAIMDRSRP